MDTPRAPGSRILCMVLGAWLGGSLVIGGVVTYNFSGLNHLFERNPALASRSGFNPDNENARKTSVVWVHSSELNRVFFEAWGMAQLGLAALSILVALLGRHGRALVIILLLALGLVAYLQFVVTPEIVSLGRQLDFTPRDPPPPQLEPFGKQHGLYFGLDLLRLLAVVAAAVLALWRGISLAPKG